MKKVLLIDDSVTIHRVIDLSIDSERFDIVKVFSSEDAALKLGEQVFDFILLDNKLDNVSIQQYVKELKSMQDSAKIILLVGAFDKFGSADLEKTSADDYLVKPFDSQSLNAKLNDDEEHGESDVMSTGFVERIAEADEQREYNDPDSVPAPLTGSPVMHHIVEEGAIIPLENDADEFAGAVLAEDPDVMPDDGELLPHPEDEVIRGDEAHALRDAVVDEPVPTEEEPEEKIIEPLEPAAIIDDTLEEFDTASLEMAGNTATPEEDPQAEDESYRSDYSSASVAGFVDSISDDTLNAILEEPDQFDVGTLDLTGSDIEPFNTEPADEPAPIEPMKPATLSAGGISINISREEIAAMLGNAIDKKLLESVIKDVLTKNISDIIREIVPALAEKYIKEEIERLKEDE